MSESRSGSEFGPRSDRSTTTVEQCGLELLSDDCASRILSIVVTEPAPAREIAQRLDVSRATVYRRLDRLEEAGLVDATLSYDPGGHHRRVYRATVDQLTVTISDDGVTVEPADDGPAVAEPPVAHTD